MSASSILELEDAIACCEDERWKPIPNWPHEASSCGRVRSIDRLDAAGRLLLGGILPQHPDRRPGKGYLYVTLRDGKRRRKAAVAVLVLEAHRELRPGSGYEACHSHGVRTDNHLAKIRWDTKKANRADRECHRMDNAPDSGSRWAPPEGRPGVLITVGEAIAAAWFPPTWSDPRKVFSVAKIRIARAGGVTPQARARAADGNTLLYHEVELAEFIREATSYLQEPGLSEDDRPGGLNGNEKRREREEGRGPSCGLNGVTVTGQRNDQPETGSTPSDLRSVTSQALRRAGRYMRRYMSRQAA